MNVQTITESLIKLPHVFNSLGTISISDLLKETGYYEMNQQITEEIIHTELIKQPQSVCEWLTYSEDKRSSTGWYLKQDGINSFTLGFIGGGRGEYTQQKYVDQIAACAAFIKREAENIRTTMQSGK